MDRMSLEKGGGKILAGRKKRSLRPNGKLTAGWKEENARGSSGMSTRRRGGSAVAGGEEEEP